MVTEDNCGYKLFFFFLIYFGCFTDQEVYPGRGGDSAETYPLGHQGTPAYTQFVHHRDHWETKHERELIPQQEVPTP